MEGRTQREITPQAHQTFAKSQRWDRQWSQDETFLLGREDSGPTKQWTDTSVFH